jgi:protein gp37
MATNSHMSRAHWHQYQVLTKRSDRLLNRWIYHQCL